ncbi:MAG TPA: hypothetical protein VHT27_04705 [Solirubrobacteraceae bacterium]|jgi:hypothetical protein|nr:hypothetical protein [Solirubrobacteraceae bacterium]
MPRTRTLRNVAIIAAIAAAVAFVPGGGHAADGVAAALWATFGIGFGFLGLRVYRERRVWLLALGDRHRALLYGAAALAIFAWASRARWWASSLGEAVWFLMIVFIVYVAMEIYRHTRAY